MSSLTGSITGGLKNASTQERTGSGLSGGADSDSLVSNEPLKLGIHLKTDEEI